MICTTDLAVPAEPHFSLAGCDTRLPSTSTSITFQSVYTGKVYSYYMACLKYSSQTRVRRRKSMTSSVMA